MKRLTVEQLGRDGLGDHRLQSIEWSADGHDVRLEFAAPGSRRASIGVVFRFASQVRIEIDFGEYSGAPLVYSSRFQRTDSGELAVSIEFGAAPEGQLSLLCNDADARELSLPDPPKPGEDCGSHDGQWRTAAPTTDNE